MSPNGQSGIDASKSQRFNRVAAQAAPDHRTVDVLVNTAGVFDALPIEDLAETVSDRGYSIKRALKSEVAENWI